SLSHFSLTPPLESIACRRWNQLHAVTGIHCTPSSSSPPIHAAATPAATPALSLSPATEAKMADVMTGGAGVMGGGAGGDGGDENRRPKKPP
ncbi:hypothetical protein LINPERPRIM_LOCUS41653, partial [Linum perenne]